VTIQDFENELTALHGSEQVIQDKTREGSHTLSILTGGNITTLRGRDWGTIVTRGGELQKQGKAGTRT